MIEDHPVPPVRVLRNQVRPDHAGAAALRVAGSAGTVSLDKRARPIPRPPAAEVPETTR